MAHINLEQVAKRMAGMRTTLLLDEPFFGTLALQLQLMPDTSEPTAWVDGVSFGYNPGYVMSLDAERLKGLVAHEVMHCALGHPWRRFGRDPDRWNEACDRVINPILRDAGFRLPDGALYELDPTHAGKSAEWVYDRLSSSVPPSSQQGGGQGRGQGGQGQSGAQGPGQSGGKGSGGGKGRDDARDTSKGQGQGQGSPDPSKTAGNGPSLPHSTPKQGPKGSGPQGAGNDGTGQRSANAAPAPSPRRFDTVRDAPRDTSNDAKGEKGGDAQGTNGGASPDGQEAMWQRAVQQAAALAKGQGRLPGSLQRAVTASGLARVDWRSATRRFVQEKVASDYSYARPNARYVFHGLYVPSLYEKEVGVLVVAIDTSGSVDEVLLQQFGVEVTALFEEVKPRKLVVLYADSRIAHSEEFERGDTIKLHPHGGGGTDFRPVFKHVAEWNEEAPVAVIYLTDLMGTFPAQEPGVPVLWVTGHDADTSRYSCKVRVPFGEVVTAA